MSTGFRALASAVAVTLMASAAALPAQAGEAWEFEITPYLWASGIDADVIVRNQPASVSADFSDIIKAFDIGGAFLMRAQRGHLVLWTQLDYFKLSTDKLDDQPQNGSLDLDQLLVTAGIGRNFGKPGGRQSVDVLLGVRHLGLDTKLQIDTIGTFTGNKSYTDPLIIIRPSFQLSERWRLNPTFSYGTGGDSESTYELQPQLQFQMTEHAALRFGYRKVHYDIKNSSNGNSFDGSFNGPFIGFGWTFGGEPEPPPPPPP
jgi:hypothetical protein